MPIAAPPKLCWYQYRLRTLFVVLTLIGVALGLYIGPKVRRHNLVLAIEAAGGHVDYEEPPDNDSWVMATLREKLPRDSCDEITEVSSGRDTGDATLDGFETLTGLRIFYLYGKEVTNDGLIHLKDLTGLQELRMTVPRVTDAGLVHLQCLTGLQCLELRGTQFTDAGLAHLKGLSGLQWLWLIDTQITVAGRADLKKSLPECHIRVATTRPH